VSRKGPSRLRRRPGRFVILALWIGVPILPALLVAAPGAGEHQLRALSDDALRKLKASDFEGAASAYQQIVKLNPASAEAHSNLGLALYELGRYEGAIPEFSRALALNPNLTGATVLLGLTYSALHQYRRRLRF